MLKAAGNSLYSSCSDEYKNMCYILLHTVHTITVGQRKCYTMEKDAHCDLFDQQSKTKILSVYDDMKEQQIFKFEKLKPEFIWGFFGNHF